MVNELVEAVRAVRELDSKIPILAQVTVNDDGQLLSGASLETFVTAAADLDIDALGLNCSVGPKAMLEALDRLRPLTRRQYASFPVSPRPCTAGCPWRPGGRPASFAPTTDR